MISSSSPIAAAWPDSATFWRDKRAVVSGISSPYEEPEAPELVVESDLVSAEGAVETIEDDTKRQVVPKG